MQKQTIIFALLFILTGIFYYNITGNVVQDIRIEKVISITDGDTITIESGQKVRLIGINTPERGKSGYQEAKDHLNRLENKTIRLETYKLDRYGRVLAHIFYQNKHINKEILENGLGHLYYYEKDDYYKRLENAEKKARAKELGIWKKSQNKECLTLLELKYTEQPRRCSNDEVLKIKNSCNFDLQIVIKDEATHHYKETIKANSIFTKSFSCIFNNDGDTLFIWDENGLILFHRY